MDRQMCLTLLQARQRFAGCTGHHFSLEWTIDQKPGERAATHYSRVGLAPAQYVDCGMFQGMVLPNGLCAVQ
jgi:hypothetical protein